MVSRKRRLRSQTKAVDFQSHPRIFALPKRDFNDKPEHL
jgi:hypothetical protein